VHITGGGGEQGPASRVPESYLSVFTTNGITTVVGLLGTDGITRSIENLVAKARALTEEGITVYCLTNYYAYPPTTMTGSVEKDIVMITPMIGVKVAVSDHRSSNPSGEDLIALGVQARRAGLLSNTPGLVTMHMGSGKGKLDPLFYALENSDIPVKNFLPTHMLRTDELIDEGAKLVRMGGFMDCTAGSDDNELELHTDKLFELLNRDGVTADHVTLSSDAFGSQPKFDAAGVSNSGSISLNKIIPVDAVPVNIPNIEKNASCLYSGYILLHANLTYKNVPAPPNKQTNNNGNINPDKFCQSIAAIPATIITSKNIPDNLFIM
jgi:beta-aspartyl-dipeptidase (metallo-type)